MERKATKAVKIENDRGGDVNFQISQKCELITVTNGYKEVAQGFRVALPPDAIEGGIISAKLANGPDVFLPIPIYIGGYNDYILKEINTTGHSLGAVTTLYIGY